MDPLSFYASQSPLTNPGDQCHLFSDLPKTVPEICGIIQGVCLDCEERYKYPIPNERLLETNSRYVEAILKQITALSNQPLTEARAPERRFMASSSDFASLFCAIMRFQGVPARKRVGFATYYTTTKHGVYRSHEIAEYWDSAQNSWIKVDPVLDELAVKANNISFSPCNLPEGQFLPAWQAWQACRGNQLDPGLFRDEETKGLGIVLSNLILDLVNMNKIELLNWDRFGWMERSVKDLCDEEWEILDNLAELLQAGDKALEDLHALYSREAGFQVPRVITCNTPVTPPHKVTLTR